MRDGYYCSGGQFSDNGANLAGRTGEKMSAGVEAEFIC